MAAAVAGIQRVLWSRRRDEMLPTYKATLTGNQLKWYGDAPRQSGTLAVEVYVTILNEGNANTEKSAQGKMMVAALEKLAQNSAVADISDPVAWQRDERAERKLPRP